jgi:hypothetical protein
MIRSAIDRRSGRPPRVSEGCLLIGMQFIEALGAGRQGTNYLLDGIDAPETEQKCLDRDAKPWQCGKSATAALSRFIVGKSVTCDDVGEDRRYHRRLGRCFAANERKARVNRCGIWSGCFTDPRDFRYSNKSTASMRRMPEGSRRGLPSRPRSLPWGASWRRDFEGLPQRGLRLLREVGHPRGR